MDTREQLVEKIVILYCKWCPNNCKGLTNEERKGCLASGGFADDVLPIIEQSHPEVKGWKEAVKAERAKVFNELEDYIKQYGRMAVFPCEDERSKEWQSLKGAK